MRLEGLGTSLEHHGRLLAGAGARAEVGDGGGFWLATECVAMRPNETGNKEE